MSSQRLGLLLRFIRESLGMGRKAFGDKLGVSRVLLAEQESCRFGMKPDYLRAIARQCGFVLFVDLVDPRDLECVTTPTEHDSEAPWEDSED